MSKIISVTFLGGGLEMHPVNEQFSQIEKNLGDGWSFTFADGADAFDHLETCDLFIVAGLHWTESDTITWNPAYPYRAPSEKQKDAFRSYVASGRPVLCYHGGIASFDDWPEFGKLLGFTWRWGLTTHSSIKNWKVKIDQPEHPIMDGIQGFQAEDEIYYNVQVSPESPLQILASCDDEDLKTPLAMITEGGRIEGAGTTVYLANGHDMKAFTPTYQKIIANTMQWLTRS